jgi:putative ABC transport system ATP-binding protein
MGPSGCGKTTLLNLIGMLDRPTEGSVVVRGRDTTSMNDDIASDLRLREVGFVFQNFNLIPTMTVLENVQLPMRFAQMSRMRMENRARMLLNAVGLEDRMGHLPSELSGGEQQRVSIARSLANDPSIIILDEPTGELDSAMGQEIVTLLKRLNKRSGKTMIMASHDPTIASHADRVVRMLDGKVVS